MRTKKASPERFYGPAACVAAGLLLSACSADVTRFDFPAFSLGQNGTDTSSLPAPPEPIKQYEKRPVANDTVDRVQPYQVAQLDTSVNRSNLGRPTDDVDDLDYGARTSSDADRSYRNTNQFTTVQRGDTLYGISRRTGVSVARIKQANNLRGNNIRVGQRLIVPGATGLSQDIDYGAPRSRQSTDAYDEPRTTARVGDRLSLDTPSERTSWTDDQADSAASEGTTYRIKSGDSLYAISRRTGVSAARLAEVNGITDPTRLRIGQVLTIPGATNRLNTASADRTEPTRSTSSNYDNTYGIIRDTPPPITERKVASLDKTSTVSDNAFSDVAPVKRVGSDTSFRWPVRGRIISRFGGRTASGNNDGINLAVPEGTSVKAVEDGVVAYAGSELKGYGKLLLIRHDNDWVSAYAHNAELLVQRGDKIRRGQIVAKAGRTGSVDRPQLHFELRKGSKPVDPLKHLASY